MKRTLLILTAAFVGCGFAHAIEFPKDLPTIEALIDLHKMIKG